MSAELPKGWKVAGNQVGDFDGFVINKGFKNSVSVIVMEGVVPSDNAEEMKDQFKANLEATGMTISKAEVQQYDSLGEGIILVGKGEVTQELVDSNVASGVVSESDAKKMKSLIGKDKTEVLVYFLLEDKIVGVDGLTFSDDAAGMEEVVNFIANSTTLS